MRIIIEDYYGNNVIGLQFFLKDSEISKERANTINSMAIEYGYSVADIDDDEQGQYVRVQQIDDNQTVEVDLDLLISTLTAEFR
jgi:hypothetical protein